MRSGVRIARIEGRWVYRPKPQPDELLTSFLIRAAHGYGLKLTTFLNAIWGTERSLLGRDLDNFAPDHVINKIAEGAGLDPRHVSNLTLANLRDRLNASDIPSARKPWILVTSILAQSRYRPGLQYCPLCLSSSNRPYLRRTWRIAFATCCTEHGVALKDCCPHCGAALHPHRAENIRYCYLCGGDLASAADSDEVARVERHEAARHSGMKPPTITE
jgi:hypothetical protein